MRSAVLDRRSHIAIRVPGVLLRLWCTRAGLCPRYKVLLELESLFPNPFSILTLILLIIRPPESTREESRVANAYPHNTRVLVHAVMRRHSGAVSMSEGVHLGTQCVQGGAGL